MLDRLSLFSKPALARSLHDCFLSETRFGACPSFVTPFSYYKLIISLFDASKCNSLDGAPPGRLMDGTWLGGP